MVYTIELSPDEEKMVQRRAAKLGITPQEYVRRAFDRQLRPRPSSNLALTEEEKQALAILNAQLPTTFWERYAELTQKIRERSLTQAEHTEIKKLAAQEEAWGVTRLQLLQTMAKKRNTSTLDLMKYNGIGHHPNADRFLNQK